MKTPEEITTQIAKRVADSWQDDACRPYGSGDPPKSAWPHTFAIGALSKAELQAQFSQIAAATNRWRQWARDHDTMLTTATRIVHSTNQQIPTHATVPNAQVAAAIVGGPWSEQLTRGHERATLLAREFPALTPAELAKVVRTTIEWTDTDIELVIAAGHWFTANDATGLTPRQVPLEGFHAKWLNTGQTIVSVLCGKPELGLVTRHPSVVNFTYLDPEHRRVGRHHDSAVIGDAMTPAYMPRVVIITENKDTAVGFPEVAGGIAVQGHGKGARAVASLEWIRHCPLVVYWGDIDSDGYEILDEHRGCGLDAVSILMTPDTLREYQRFASPTDRKGVVVTAREPKRLTHLSPPEQEAYAITCGRDGVAVRIEQERIPLRLAQQHIETLLNDGLH